MIERPFYLKNSVGAFLKSKDTDGKKILVLSEENKRNCRTDKKMQWRFDNGRIFNENGLALTMRADYENITGIMNYM